MSWFYLGEMMFDVNEWYVVPTNRDVAKALIEKHHYSKSVSFLGVYIFGLFKRGDTEIKGVSWWIPPAKGSVDKYNPGKHKSTLSLHRLVIVPGVPTNGASYLIGRSIRLIKQAGLYSYLITYADTWQGHTGAIYKATNWEYRGMSSKTPVWVNADGKQVSNLNRHMGRRASYTTNELRDNDCKMLGRFAKHVYTMALNVHELKVPIQLSMFAEAA